jgi:hypothetical protein
MIAPARSLVVPARTLLAWDCPARHWTQAGKPASPNATGTGFPLAGRKSNLW